MTDTMAILLALSIWLTLFAGWHAYAAIDYALWKKARARLTAEHAARNNDQNGN